MQLKPEQFPQHLTQPLASLYIFASDEHLLLQEAADMLRTSGREQGFSEREVLTVVRGFDWNQLQQAHQTLSLFGDRKLIELRIPSGKPGKEGSQALQTFCNHLNQDTLTLITLPRLDRAARDSTWANMLAQKGYWIDFPTVERTQLPRWIAMRLTQQQQSTTADALQFIADRVEGNLLAAHQEIQKLGLLFPSGKLSLEQVQESVLNVARYDVFKLSEAMLSGDTVRLLQMLEGLRAEGEAPVLVLWALTEEIRILAKIRQGLDTGRSLTQLLRENRIWGSREHFINKALSDLNSEKINAALCYAALIDQQIKGLKVKQLHTDSWMEMLNLGLKLHPAHT